LARNEPLRVVFLSDVGFQYGAGTAVKRQAASMLLLGWHVSVVAQSPGKVLNSPMVTGIPQFETWQGVHRAPAANSYPGLSSEEFIAKLVAQIETLNADLVVTGNLHGANWPLTLLSKLKSLGMQVVAFMHDTYFVTGRCAQPLNCTLYQTGCDARCPTWNEYPRLPPHEIAPAWHTRGQIFSGADRMPLLGNSHWTRNIALQRFGATATTDVVHLGLDHELFAPIGKSTARRMLDIPDKKPIVVMGAVDVHNQWKGGHLFHGLHRVLADRDDVEIILFGRSSETLKCLRSFGWVQDERMMPLILNAADIFISTATAESFGQSLLEASACALPVIALNVGGVSDVITHNETGILIEHAAVTEFLAAVDRLVGSAVERENMGRNGRIRVENNFTLGHQANAWVDCLKRIC
jgi:glycosyltransferase involved in cell wall biosynthesis